MARYEHLSLYKTAIDLAVYIETVGGSFDPRKRNRTRGMTLETRYEF